MGNGINNVVIAGRITKDPELKVTTTGKSVCHFRVAVPGMKDETDFIQCSAWDHNAHYLERYVRKGMWVAVHGKLKQVSYSKDGKDVSTYEVVAVQVISPKQDDGIKHDDFIEVLPI